MALLAVESDEQVREDGGELPEDVEGDQVVAEDEGEHRAGEREEVPGEAGQPGCRVAEVGGAVQQDERADAGREQHHEFGERVEAQVHRYAVVGHPGPGPVHRGAGGGRLPPGERPAGGGSGRQREDEEGARAQPSHQRAREGREDEVGDDERGHTAELRGAAAGGGVCGATERTEGTKYRYIPGAASPVRPAEIRAALDLDPHVPLLVGDVRERPFGRDVLLALVDHLMSLPVASPSRWTPRRTSTRPWTGGRPVAGRAPCGCRRCRARC